MKTTRNRGFVAACLCAVLPGTAVLRAADLPGADQPELAQSTPKPAQPVGVLSTPDDAGEFLSRSALTGDWGGTRQEWAKKGITLDGYLTQVGMGVVSGGRDTGWEYLGRGEIDLNLDTGKMGLWPGGIFSVIAEGHFGNPISTAHAGVLVPVNINEVFPESDNSFVLSQFIYTQFLSEKLAIFAGKMTTITQTSGDLNEFAHGKGDRQFLNTAFGANPVLFLTVPYSTWGGGALFLPTKELQLEVAVIDSHGRADSAQFDTAFSNGVTFIVEGRGSTNFWDKAGHQLLGATYSTSSYTDLDQSLDNLIIPGLPTQEANNSWSVYYNFDQYLYQPDRKVNKGIGIFGRLGLSDGEANPIHWAASGGIGGKGMFSRRPNDGFGVGYFYNGIADTEITSDLGFGDSQGVEAFYDFAVTPWLHVSPDVQWIHPGKDTVDDSVIVGVRVFMAF